MLHPTHVNVARRSATMPFNVRRSEAMIHQLPLFLAVATLPVVLVKRDFLREHSAYANSGLMMSLPRLYHPNLVSSRYARFVETPFILWACFHSVSRGS